MTFLNNMLNNIEGIGKKFLLKTDEYENTLKDKNKELDELKLQYKNKVNNSPEEKTIKQTIMTEFDIDSDPEIKIKYDNTKESCKECEKSKRSNPCKINNYNLSNGVFNCDESNPYYVDNVNVSENINILDIDQENTTNYPNQKDCDSKFGEINNGYQFNNKNNSCYVIDGLETSNLQDLIFNNKINDEPIDDNGTSVKLKINNFKHDDNLTTSQKSNLEYFTENLEVDQNILNNELRNIPSVNNKLKEINNDSHINNNDLKRDIEQVTNELLIEQDKFTLKSVMANILNKIIILISIILICFISFHTIDIKKYINNSNKNILGNLKKKMNITSNSNSSNSNSTANLINRYK